MYFTDGNPILGFYRFIGGEVVEGVVFMFRAGLGLSYVHFYCVSR